MRLLLLIDTDSSLLGELTAPGFGAETRGCLQHADELKTEGTLIDFQQLQPAATARTVRVRGGRAAVIDGSFAQTKGMLAGLDLIEAESIEEAVRIAEGAMYGFLTGVGVEGVTVATGQYRDDADPAAADRHVSAAEVAAMHARHVAGTISR